MPQGSRSRPWSIRPPLAGRTSFRETANKNGAISMSTSCASTPINSRLRHPGRTELLYRPLHDRTVGLGLDVSRTVPWCIRPCRRGLGHFEFTRETIAAVTSKPVFAAPLPIVSPCPAVVDRAAFGLPEDRTLFLFCFDLLSVLERKNPLGLIEAYTGVWAEMAQCSYSSH